MVQEIHHLQRLHHHRELHCSEPLHCFLGRHCQLPKHFAQANNSFQLLHLHKYEKNARSQGRLVINLQEIIRNPSQSDILVKDGDILTVPQIPYAVSVSGEVQFPSSHMYEKNLQIDDYLLRSGGFTKNADKDRTFVVKANGSVMSKSSNTWFNKVSSVQRIGPGDVIVVPVDLKQTKFLENLTYGTQIIYQLAVAAAAVNSF